MNTCTQYNANHSVMSALSNLTIPSRPYPNTPPIPNPRPFLLIPIPGNPKTPLKPLPLQHIPYSTLGLILLFKISLGTKLLTLILTSVPGCCRNTVASVALLSCRCSRAAARPPGTPPGTPSNDTLGGRSGTSGTPSSAPIPTPTPVSPSPSDRFDPRRGRATSRSRCSSTRAACCETHELMVRKRASDDRAVATLSRPAAIGGAAAAVAAPFKLRFRFAFDARAPASAGVCGAWLFVQLKRLTSGPPKPTLGPGPGRGAGAEEVRRLKRDWRKVGGGGCGSCGSGTGSEEAVKERVRVVEALWRVVWRGSAREAGSVLGLRAWEAERVERGGESRRKLRGPSSSGVWLRVLLGGGWVSGLVVS